MVAIPSPTARIAHAAAAMSRRWGKSKTSRSTDSGYRTMPEADAAPGLARAIELRGDSRQNDQVEDERRNREQRGLPPWNRYRKDSARPPITMWTKLAAEFVVLAHGHQSRATATRRRQYSSRSLSVSAIGDRRAAIRLRSRCARDCRAPLDCPMAASAPDRSRRGYGLRQRQQHLEQIADPVGASAADVVRAARRSRSRPSSDTPARCRGRRSHPDWRRGCRRYSTGCRGPASISAICRAKLDVTNADDCLGSGMIERSREDDRERRDACRRAFPARAC